MPRTGVIFVTTEAQRRGYSSSSEDWCNLGQGMPESEALPGAPPRISELPIREGDHEYAPVAGLWELREAIADFYNEVLTGAGCLGSKLQRGERGHLGGRAHRAHPHRGRVARPDQPGPLSPRLHGV